MLEIRHEKPPLDAAPVGDGFAYAANDLLLERAVIVLFPVGTTLLGLELYAVDTFFQYMPDVADAVENASIVAKWQRRPAATKSCKPIHQCLRRLLSQRHARKVSSARYVQHKLEAAFVHSNDLETAFGLDLLGLWAGALAHHLAAKDPRDPVDCRLDVLPKLN